MLLNYGAKMWKMVAKNFVNLEFLMFEHHFHVYFSVWDGRGI